MAEIELPIMTDKFFVSNIMQSMKPDQNKFTENRMQSFFMLS